MNLDVQDKNTYKSNIHKISDMFKAIVPTATTAVGSVIYDLVIRPISILTTVIAESFENTVYRESLSYLSQSDNREVGRPDYVLSNYFITRRSGTRPSGVITIYTSEPITRIPAGSAFIVSGVSIQVVDAIVGVFGDNQTTYQGEATVEAHRSGDLYCFNVPVVAISESDHIIPEGTPVEASSYINGFVSASLASALEGGSAGETDAEMVNRARVNVCSWSGCSNSMHKLLNNSGITVYSSASFDGSDPEMSRIYGSPVYIGTAGMIDVYVKTSQYPLSGAQEITIPTGGDITNLIPKGCLEVSAPDGITVEWGSAKAGMTAAGARFSTYQTVKLLGAEEGASVSIKYTYMPYIDELQRYLDRSDVRTLGSSVVVKAAIPVFTRIVAVCVPGNYDNKVISDLVKRYVNSLPVGLPELNSSDIQEYISNNAPGAYIRNPVHIQTVTYTYDGSRSHVENSLSGHISSPSTSSHMTGNIRFFCVSDSEVAIE